MRTMLAEGTGVFAAKAGDAASGRTKNKSTKNRIEGSTLALVAGLANRESRNWMLQKTFEVSYGDQLIYAGTRYSIVEASCDDCRIVASCLGTCSSCL